MEVKRLGIIGTGLIGASVGLAAKRAGVPLVEGYDFYDNVAEAARERGAVDQTAIAADELLADSELVVVAVPVIVDPSHAAGRRDLVLPLARAAAAVGADGIIVESHPSPEEALCDGPQQIPTAEFGEFAREVRQVAELLGKQIG